MFAVIADIVGSRKLPSREAAQIAVERAIRAVQDDYKQQPRPLTPTVGDEFQGVYDDLISTLTSLLLLQLRLPGKVDVRFGIGVGDVRPVHSSSNAPIEDGPGWWAARRAIETVHKLEQTRVPRARTWMIADQGHSTATSSFVSTVNAYLALRDHVVGGMGERSRRLIYGTWLGKSQEVLAQQEGITQSAVSQALARAGSSALLVGLQEIAASAPRDFR